MSICIVFNPAARGERARRFRRRLDRIGAEAVLKLTRSPGEARALAAEAVREGFDTIVAAGGDGTVNEVLNGIIDEPDGLARARLGVLPLGTMNVLAREHGVPTRLLAAWEIIRAGTERRIDLIRAQFTVDGSPRWRHFAQLAGAGWDARAIHRVNWGLKKKLGPLAYVLAGLQAMRGRQPLVQARAGAHVASGELVLIGNGRFYAGPFPFFPGAVATDGRLDVCVFARVNWLALARFSLGLLRGRPAAGAVHLTGESVELCSDQVAPLELEGEAVGDLPARCEVAPGALRLLAPGPRPGW